MDKARTLDKINVKEQHQAQTNKNSYQKYGK